MAPVGHARAEAAIEPAEPAAVAKLLRLAAAAPGDEPRFSIHQDLPAIAEDWRAFEQEADCTVFQTYAWLSCWQRCVGAPAGVRPVIVIERDRTGDILFMLPLAVQQRGFARELVWLGSDLCDYNAPLLAPDFSARVDAGHFVALWQRITNALQSDARLRFDVVNLTKMPEKVGGQNNPMLALRVRRNPSGAYLTQLAESWDEFYSAKRSANTRRRDRTKRKRLADLGEVKLVTPESDTDVLATLDTLMAQKECAFARMGVPNLFARPGYRDFYQALATDPATRPMVHISRLDVGETPAAVNLALIRKGVHYHLQASYSDGEVSRFGPGVAHLHDLMRIAIERGCRVFDFTIGDEGYKRDWADTELTLYDHIAAATWRGVLVTGGIVATQRLKRFIKQTPLLRRLFSTARAFVGAVKGGRGDR